MADLFRSKSSEQDWLAKFEDLALAASVTAPAQQRAQLESLLKLLVSTAHRTEAIGIQLPEMQVFFAMLDAQAYETAALMLIPAGAGFMASNDGNDRYIVSILLGSSQEESTSVGLTLGMAIVSAMALAIAEVSSRRSSQVTNLEVPGRDQTGPIIRPSPN